MQIPPSLRYRKFALLWGGFLISTAGSQMQLWALYWHIRTLSDQPAAVSIVGLVRFVPILIFALFGGLVADRYDRRKVLFLTQSVMLGAALALALLTWSGQIQLWHIYAITAIQAVTISFDLPARQALIPNLMPRALLPNAFSLNSIAGSLGSIIGPALERAGDRFAGPGLHLLLQRGFLPGGAGGAGADGAGRPGSSPRRAGPCRASRRSAMGCALSSAGR